MTTQSISSTKDKGKAKGHISVQDGLTSSEVSDGESATTTTSDSEIEIDSDSEITQDYLDSLLKQARKTAQETAQGGGKFATIGSKGEEFIILDEDEISPIPPLNPGKLPKIYTESPATRKPERSYKPYVPSLVAAEQRVCALGVPTPPVAPGELTKEGRSLTKRVKQLKNRTAGKDWFDLPAPEESDLPKLYHEVEAMRLRNQLDPKRFYRKDEGEGKGIKGLPKHFAIGTILPTSNPFGASTSDNLPRSHRKRTLLDELLDGAEEKRYAKKKFLEFQTARRAKGRQTLHDRKALRAPKW